MPIYTTEHCNTVVALTKILNIGKLAFIVCMNLYLYCISDSAWLLFFLFFTSVGCTVQSDGLSQYSKMEKTNALKMPSFQILPV